MRSTLGGVVAMGAEMAALFCGIARDQVALHPYAGAPLGWVLEHRVDDAVTAADARVLEHPLSQPTGDPGVVAGEEAGSKLDKAAALGVEIINEAALLEKLGDSGAN